MSGITLGHIKPYEEEDYEEVVALLADNTASNSRGSSASTTTYLLEPRLWMRDIVDAAQKKFRFAEFAHQVDIPKGYVNTVIPIRKKMEETYSATVTPGTAVNYSTLNNYDGVEANAEWKNYGHAITYDTIQQNALDYVALAKEELIYHAGDEVDQGIVDTLSGATVSASSTTGYQTVWGGDASSSATLAAGDILTTDMVAEGKKKLQSDLNRYWSGGSESISASTYNKNPWLNDNKDFTIIIAPEQEEAFLTDSQFINAAEYGKDTIIHNGEVGEYLGTKVVVSVNTKYIATSGTGTTDGTTAAVGMNACPMFKAKKAYALAYQKRPTLHVVDFPRELEVDLILEQSYGSVMMHNDALCYLEVSQV